MSSTVRYVSYVVNPGVVIKTSDVYLRETSLKSYENILDSQVFTGWNTFSFDDEVDNQVFAPPSNTEYKDNYLTVSFQKSNT